MLGFSIQKILVLVAILAAVWYGFKLIGRMDKARKAEAKLRGRQGPSKAKSRAASGSDGEVTAEDMVQCPVCKAYVAARSSSNCGRDDCPY